MTDFERIERYLLGRSPQSVRPLEIQFNALRGEISAGLKGEELATRLDRLSTEVETWSPGSKPGRRGRSAPAFFESLITIVREGIEVILVLAMLIALVVKADRARRRVRRRPDELVVRAGDAGHLARRRPGRHRQPRDGRGLESAGGLGAGPGARSSRAW